MNKISRLIVVCFVMNTLLVSGQVEELSSPIANPLIEEAWQQLGASKSAAAPGDTINLPFVDDFSAAGSYPDASLWIDRKVYINTTMAVGPITLGVATFDGLDENGRAYNASYSGSDTVADMLTSKYLDLSSTSDSVYLSFFYQLQGLGESPSSNDSLVLDFWSPSDTAWLHIWSISGGDSVQPFRQVMIPVSDARFLVNGFRFRFKTYGSLSGSFDHWHLEYVKLDDNRNKQDTVIEDPAYTLSHPSLLKDYEAMPWRHYLSNQTAFVKDTIIVSYRRNGQGIAGFSTGDYELFDENGALTTLGGAPVFFNPPLNKDTTHTLLVDTIPFVPVTTTDDFTLEMKTFLAGQNSQTNNDTIRRVQLFSNYYAYDDGSAERSYGIKNLAGAQMAYFFDPVMADTLLGFYVHFLESGIDVTQNEFRICIWENQNGAPGALIYRSDSLYQPRYSYAHNQFMPYILDTALYMNAPFFIGTEQSLAEKLNIGFDLNTVTNRYIYYGDGTTWYQSLHEGSLMLRPIFDALPKNLSVRSPEKPGLSFRVYPNPAKNHLRISMPGNAKEADYSYTIYDSFGRVIRTAGILQENVTVSTLPNGLYFMQLYNTRTGLSATERFIILK